MEKAQRGEAPVQDAVWAAVMGRMYIEMGTCLQLNRPDIVHVPAEKRRSRILPGSRAINQSAQNAER